MNVLLSGCSFSDYSGWGEPGNKLDPRCWYNIVAKENQFNLTNVSFGGKSNREIIHSALETIFCSEVKFDLIIIQLTSTDRNWFFNSETYHGFSIVNGNTITNYNNNNEYLALQLFKVRFANRAREIERDLTSLISLYTIAKQKGIKVLLMNFLNFANTCQTFRDDYIQDNICGDLTDSVVTKIKKMYTMLDQLPKIGFEITLFESQIDFADDKMHPGEKSNRLYADLVNSKLKDMEILT